MRISILPIVYLLTIEPVHGLEVWAEEDEPRARDCATLAFVVITRPHGVRQMPYTAADDRYDTMSYRRTGRSGLLLPEISLGLWQNFGDTRPIDTQRAILRRAFDLGVTHIDLANNYGPPYGAAERNFGR